MKMQNTGQDTLILCGYHEGGFPLILHPLQKADVDPERLKIFLPEDLRNLKPIGSISEAPKLPVVVVVQQPTQEEMENDLMAARLAAANAS
jgi:hypothetical protein